MTDNYEAQETALLLTKCIFQPLVDYVNDPMLTPSEYYFKTKDYIQKMEVILSKGDLNDLRNK